MSKFNSKAAVAAIVSAAESLLGYEAVAGKLATVRVVVTGSEGEALATFNAPVAALREFAEVARDGVVAADKMLDEIEQIITALESGDLSKLPEGWECEELDADDEPYHGDLVA